MSNKRFVLLGVLTEIVYLLFWVIRYAHFGKVYQYNLLENNFAFGIVIGFILLLLLFYLLASKFEELKKVSYKLILFFAILFNFTIVCILPIASDDLFSYISVGRIISKYHENPYVVSYDHFQNDILYPKIKTVWSQKTTAYGPVFPILDGILAFLGGDNLKLSIYLYKFLFMALNILIGLLIYKITKSRQAMVLYSWNPLILFEISINSHNDALLVLFFILSLYFLFKKNTLKYHLLAWFFLVISALTKYFSGIFLPFYFIYSLKTLPTKEDKFKYFFLSGFGGLVIVILSFFPFWTSPYILSGSLSFYGTRTMIQQLGINSNDYRVFRIIANILLGIIFIFKILNHYLKEKTPYQLVNTLALIFAFFLILGFGLVLPWYLVLLVALLSICVGLSKKNRTYVLVLFGSTVYAFLQYFLIR
ncbi:MAG: glycosyltransferase family 39 protein [Candidatus Woesebacteria bacterium]|nr:glycosyltransferase family 39 protein [Candidatus Woesebacteria bacterium]